MPLETRIDALEDAINGSRMHRALEIIHPSRQNDPALLSSLVSLFQAVTSLPAPSTAAHAVLTREADKANVLLLVGAPGEGKVIQIPLTWVRETDSTWYVRPNPDGKIRFGFHEPAESR